MTVYFQRSEIINNTEFSNGFYTIELHSPEIAKDSHPGQFIMIGMSQTRNDPLLPRAFSMAGRTGETLIFLYRIVGAGSEIMSRKRPGDELSIWGALGNGFEVEEGTPLFIGGGTGVAPLIDLGEELNSRGIEYTLVVGGRTSGDLEFMGGFGDSVEFIPYTEDGSLGTKGLVTEFITPENLGPDTVIYSCGPTAMLRRVSELAAENGIRCHISIETTMACGLGTCLGCSVPKRRGPGYYKTCIDGPVFNSDEVVL